MKGSFFSHLFPALASPQFFWLCCLSDSSTSRFSQLHCWKANLAKEKEGYFPAFSALIGAQKGAAMPELAWEKTEPCAWDRSKYLSDRIKGWWEFHSYLPLPLRCYLSVTFIQDALGNSSKQEAIGIKVDLVSCNYLVSASLLLTSTEYAPVWYTLRN